MKKNSINNITKGLYDEVKDVIENVKFDKSENALEFLKGVKLSEGIMLGDFPAYDTYAGKDITFYSKNDGKIASFGERIGELNLIGNNGMVTWDNSYGLEFHYYDADKYGYACCIGEKGITFDYGLAEYSSTDLITINQNGIYLNADFKINRYIHNIFISGVARNKNINVSFQVYGTDNTEVSSISGLVNLIGKNMKIAVSGYHEDLGVIIAGVTVNSNNELTFVGVNSSATSIAWSEISDVSITDSIHQL